MVPPERHDQTTSGSMFADDAHYRHVGDRTLRTTVADPALSVVTRGRSLLEIGRRAVSRPGLREALFGWVNDRTVAPTRWYGPVTLGWIAACCLGYSLTDVADRARLARALAQWSPDDRGSLFDWTRQETWFDGIADHAMTFRRTDGMQSEAVGTPDDSWSRLEMERRDLADRVGRFADFGLGVHSVLLNAGGGVPPRLVGTPIIVDTDIGGDPDDALALAVAARCVPELALVVTSDELAGERARFARHLLDLASRPEVPVVAGRSLRDAGQFCVQGLTPTEVAAQPTDVIDAVQGILASTDGPVRWVGLGPMSNLADLLQSHPQCRDRLAVTQMGGALNYRDPTRAEHNFRQDPAAAGRTLSAFTDAYLVISDVTFRPEIEVDAQSPIFQTLASAQAPAWARLLAEHLRRWFAQFHPGSRQHDALTLSAALMLPFVEFTRMRITLAADARMREANDGHWLFVSSHADYPAFNRWLSRCLEGTR